jgi:hypothetical protein
LVELDLGQISGLTVTSDKEDYITEYDKDVYCPDNWKNVVNEKEWRGYMFPGHMLIKVNIDYWFRTLTAVKFQDEMSRNMEDGLYFPVSFNTIWNVKVSSTPSNSSGYNPYVWYNTDVDVNVCYDGNTKSSETSEPIDEMLCTLETLYTKLKIHKYSSSSEFKTDKLLYNYNKVMLESLHDEHPEFNIKMKIRDIIY